MLTRDIHLMSSRQSVATNVQFDNASSIVKVSQAMLEAIGRT